MVTTFTPNSEMPAQRTLTAFFDHQPDAEKAVGRLRGLGLTDTNISLVGGDEYHAGLRDKPRGFWESLSAFFFPDEDRAAYAEGLRRGGYLLTVREVDTASYDEAIEILDDEGSVDFDARTDDWRSEGWSSSATRPEKNDISSGRMSAGNVAANARIADMSIPAANEKSIASKRDSTPGRGRVRSYSMEEPANERSVEIERRAASAARAGRELPIGDKAASPAKRADPVPGKVRSTEVEVEDARPVRVNRTTTR